MFALTSCYTCFAVSSCLLIEHIQCLSLFLREKTDIYYIVKLHGKKQIGTYHSEMQWASSYATTQICAFKVCKASLQCFFNTASGGAYRTVHNPFRTAEMKIIKYSV
jgi:hypothetical protein